MSEQATQAPSPPRRVWVMREVMYLDQPRSPEESRAIALARLRETIRGEGYVLDEATLTHGDPEPIVVNPDQTDYRYAEAGEPPNAFLTAWSAGATERLTDPAETLLDPVGEEHTEDGWLAKVFEVPDAVRAAGGGLRLRHGLDGPVLVYAYDTAGERIGYLMTVTLDDDQEHIEVVAGTARLLVIEDPEEDDGVPESGEDEE